MRPPWASMMDRLMDSPIPIPVGLVVKNASNIRSIFWGFRPVPESRTATRTPPFSNFCEDSLNSRGLPVTDAIASLPFMIKFNITCCN